MIAQEVVIQCFVPKDDIKINRAIGKPLPGKSRISPLVGTEIAVVSMSLEIHHLPGRVLNMGDPCEDSGPRATWWG